MINLLPDEVKRDIKAARMNVILLQYNFFTLLAMGILVGICLMFFIFLNISQSSAVAANEENQQAAQSLQGVVAEADDYKKNLEIAKQIFAKSTNYTEIVLAVSALIPDGVVLGNLDIQESSFDGPTVISAYAKTFDHATQLKDNLQKSDLFSDVFLQNLTNADGDSSSGDSSSTLYPVTFTISAQMNKVVGAW